MNLLRSALAGILTLLAAVSASAQQFPTVPGQSVIGRLGTAGVSGPSQAIPITKLAAVIASDILPAFSVTLYGAKCDGVTDDTIAITNAITAAIAAHGAEVVFPHGTCKVTSLTADLRTIATPFASTRLRFRGEGEYISVLSCSSTTAPCLWYRGNTGNGIGAGVVIQGMGFSGPSNLTGSVGLKLDTVAFTSVRDVQIAFFDVGMIGTDILSSSVENTRLYSNNMGCQFDSPASPIVSAPNAMAFRSVVITTNHTYGCLISHGSSVNFFGGSVENNGLNQTAQSTSAWGLKITDGGQLAGQGLNVFGTYFEGNNGSADIWIHQTGNIGNHSITGANFLRGYLTLFANNDVYVDGTAATTVKVANSTFAYQAPYVPSASFPRIKSVNASATVLVDAPVYWSATEAASFPNTATTSITKHGNSDYTILPSDRMVQTSAALTAARTWTMPQAILMPAGQQICVTDTAAGITGVNTLTVARASSDTINGSTSLVFSIARDGACLISDGVSTWTSTTYRPGSQRTPVGDANYTVVSTDTVIAYTSISAARTVNLPAASSFAAGRQLYVYDDSGLATSGNTISISPNGTDTINTVASPFAVINQAYGGVLVESNGSTGWLVRQQAMVGDVTSTAFIGNSLSTTIASHAVSNAKFRQGVARSVVGVTGNATADVADIQGTANQALVVNSGGTALAFGTVAVAGGGTGDTGTAWSSYTPTLACGSGSLTTSSASGRSKTLGKTTWIQISITVTTNGTCGGFISATLPNTANNNAAFSGQDTATNTVVTFNMSASGTTVAMVKYDGTYPGVSAHSYVVSGVYENQ